MPTTPELTIFFDGACPLCRREIAHYLRRDRSGRLAALDIAADPAPLAILGVTQRARVTAFFFRDTSEKRRLMGASNTYIAKPWRNEVYLQLGGWPHPVLFHEIVHVVAGNVGRGPFRVSGGIGGLLPSPGIVEGVAGARHGLIVAWPGAEVSVMGAEGAVNIIGRSAIEVFRGDTARGLWFGGWLSTSQIVGLGSAAIAAAWLARRR
jgi:hypothetical protein